MIQSLIGLLAALTGFWLGKKIENGKWVKERLLLAENYASALKKWMAEREQLAEENTILRRNIHEAFTRGATVADLMHSLEIGKESRH